MARKIKRIEWARVSFLSLVPRGANRLPGLYKADDETLEWSPLIKAGEDFEERGQLTALVYVPDTVDSQGHFASKQAIEKMAHTFMEEGAKLDMRHDRRELKKEQAYVAESFIVQKNDPRFEGIQDHLGKQIDPTGGWGVVIQINDPELRKAYKEGGWDGVSLWSYHGDYSLKEENYAVMKALEELQSKMEKNEFADLLKEQNRPLEESLAKLTAALEKISQPQAAPKPEGTPPAEGGKDDGTPVFKGDPTDVEALEKYQQELELHQLRKAYDFNSPEQVKEYISKVAELKESFRKSDDSEDDQGGEGNSEVERLKKELEKAQRRAGGTRVNPDIRKSEPISGLSKEDMEAFEAGKEIAAIANKNRGFSK